MAWSVIKVDCNFDLWKDK